MVEVRTEESVGPVRMQYPDGSTVTMKRTNTIIEDWRDTVLGRINFGCVVLGPWRYIREKADA